MSDSFGREVGIHQILQNIAAPARHQPPETVDGE